MNPKSESGLTNVNGGATGVRFSQMGMSEVTYLQGRQWRGCSQINQKMNTPPSVPPSART